jgi:hypothetical protein
MGGLDAVRTEQVFLYRPYRTLFLISLLPRVPAAAQPPPWAVLFSAFSAVKGYPYEDVCKELVKPPHSKAPFGRKAVFSAQNNPIRIKF